MARPPYSALPGADFFVAALWDAAQPAGIAVPGYEILSELSRGGMGVVYHARQLRPEREVALKVLLAHLAEEPEMLARFQLEARAMAALDHPGILPVFEVGESDGVPFFSMKLATGGSLSDRLDGKPVSPKESAALIIELARAVHHAHQHGVLHRDLKPGNFLFLEDRRACVSDFGLAKLSVSDHGPLTRTESFFGTPHYMPPEVAAGSAGNSTVAGDLYSLGAVFYECLTGRRPHPAKDNVAALLRSIADDPVTPLTQINPALPRDLSIVCMKALERKPGDRYATLADFADDVERWMKGHPVKARPVGKMEMAWRWAQRHPLSAGLIAALVAVTLTGAALLGISNSQLGDALQVERMQLRSVLIEQARSERLRGAPGHRDTAMAHLQKASKIEASQEIRDEAAALLARPDVVPALAFLPAPNEGWPPDKIKGDPVKARRILHGGAYGLTFHDSGTVKLWRKGVAAPVKENAVAGDFTPDGKSVILADPEKGVVVESLTDSGPPKILQPLGPLVLFLTVDHEGKKAAIAREDGLEVRELNTSAVLWHYGDSPARCAPAWSLDDSRLAVAVGDRREAVILSAENGVVCTVVPVTGWPQHLAFHPGGTLLAVAPDDGTIAICEASTGAAWTTLPCEGMGLNFSADGDLLEAMDHGDAMTWPLSLPVAFHEWQEIPRGKTDGAVSGMALSPDGSRLLTVTTGCLAVWSLAGEHQTGYRLLENQRIDARASAWWLSNDSILLQVPGGLERIAVDAAGKPGTSERLPKVPGSSVLAVQPDGGWIVRMTDEDGKETCELWPGGDSTKARPASMPEEQAREIAAVHDGSGQTAVLTSGDVIEVRSPAGKRMRLTPPLTPGVRALQFSPDGRCLLILTRQHRVFSWDLERLSKELDSRGL